MNKREPGQTGTHESASDKSRSLPARHGPTILSVGFLFLLGLLLLLEVRGGGLADPGQATLLGLCVTLAIGTVLWMHRLVRHTARRFPAERPAAGPEEYWRLFETCPLAIFVHSEGWVLFANQEACRLFAAERSEQLAGMNIYDLVHPAWHEIVRQRARGFLDRGRNSPMKEQRLVRLDGSDFVAEVMAIPLDSDGTPAVQVVMRQITDPNEAPQEREDLDAQLKHAQKMEAVGTLASGIAHDFGNLMTAIFGHLSVAQAALPEGHSALKSLERVEQAARQASAVSQSLLTVTRETWSEKEATNLNRLLADSTRLLRRILPKSIEIVDEIPAERIQWVRAHPTQMQQVLMNLAINARDAMPGGGTLGVRLTSDSSERQVPGSPQAERVTWEVWDTGVGMSQEIRGRIFEPFFTTKARGRGTGLGMTITHGIVRDHGGEVLIDSVPGEGTRVRVTLPTCEAGGTEQVVKYDESLPVRQGLGIMLVQADDQILSIMTTTLRSEGYTVFPLADGARALEMLKKEENRIALVVVDETSSSGSIRESADAIRLSCADLPILRIVSGERRLQSVTSSVNETAIEKPFSMAEFARVVRACLTMTRGGRGVVP